MWSSYHNQKLRGNLESFNISSTGNSLFVKFESDSGAQYTGFHATIHYGNPYMNARTLNSKSEI